MGTPASIGRHSRAPLRGGCPRRSLLAAPESLRMFGAGQNEDLILKPIAGRLVSKFDEVGPDRLPVRAEPWPVITVDLLPGRQGNPPAGFRADHKPQILDDQARAKFDREKSQHRARRIAARGPFPMLAWRKREFASELSTAAENWATCRRQSGAFSAAFSVGLARVSALA